MAEIPETSITQKKSRRWAQKVVGSEAIPSGVEPPPTPIPIAETSALEPPPTPIPIAERPPRSSKGKGKTKSPLDINPRVDLASVHPGLSAGRVSVGIAASFAAGAQSAYLARYNADLNRLQSRPDLPAAAKWFDSHCHLESILGRTWRGGDKPQVENNEPLLGLPDLAALWPAGLEGCVSNFVFLRPSKPGHPPEWAWLQNHLQYYSPENPLSSKLWFTVGLHPHDAANWNEDAVRFVRSLSSHPKCVGIGECGLDFFRHGPQEAELQLRAFRAQVRLAVELSKALVVHARLISAGNEEMCLRVLQAEVPSHHPIHMHCYSDSLKFALDLCAEWPNLRIGFTGSITFRDRGGQSKAKSEGKGKGKEIEKKGEEHSKALVQGIPLERILIETDGPYMCPEPFRGQTAHPGHVHRVAERIAEWKRVDLGDVMAATWKSTRLVYGIG